jgi:carbon monoxide dehydrogenase subunit G
VSDVTESVEVDVPIGTAYDQWTRFESFPWFMAGVESVSRIDATRTHWVTEVAGIRREFDAEITEQHPGERIAWRSTGGEVRHAGVVTFQRLADRLTRVTVQLAWEAHGLAEKAGSALGIDERQVRADTARFKKFIEQQGPDTGGFVGFAGGQPTPGDEADARTEFSETPGLGAPSDPAPGPDDLLETLLNQHADILQAFARLLAAPADQREPLFADLVDKLQRHETGEQNVVHPAICQDGVAGDRVAGERLAEEQEVLRAIAELENLGFRHPDFADTLRTFHETVLSHAAHEEQEEFPLLRRLPGDRLRRMAEELRALQSAP